PRKHEKQDRTDDDRVRYGEEGNRAGAEGERGNSDESVGRVEVAADQKPGDNSANRRPPSPHSCNRSRSPLRQCAAAKPSHVMKPNRATKTTSAVQFTSCTVAPPASCFRASLVRWPCVQSSVAK